MKKIVNIKDYYKKKSNYNKLFNSKKMLFISIVIGLCVGIFLWKYFVENIENSDVKIPVSNNLKYNDQEPLAVNTKDIIGLFEETEQKPILLYFYTTWCGICTKNFNNINEIAREFQNAEIKIVAIAIDRNLDNEKLRNYFNALGTVYFPIKYLQSKEGLMDFLAQKKIRYKGHIPFTMFFSAQGELITSYVGAKRKSYLRNKIIKELYPN